MLPCSLSVKVNSQASDSEETWHGLGLSKGLTTAECPVRGSSALTDGRLGKVHTRRFMKAMLPTSETPVAEQYTTLAMGSSF